MDMFQPRSLADNSPIGLGDAIAQNRQSLIGLGMGLLQPRSLAQGATPSSAWSNALGGYEQGAQADTRQAYAQAQLAHQKRQEAHQAAMDAFQRSQAAQAQSNWEKQFARSDPAAAQTDFTRAARDLGLTPGTPEHTQFAREFYAPKTEQPKIVWQDGVPYREDPRKGTVETVTPSGTPPAAGNPYAPASKMSTDEGKTSLFADRAAAAHDTISKAENINAEPGGTVGGMIQQTLPAGIANVLVSGERGKAMDAQRAFLNALLRRESGAAISAGEYTSYGKEYFPQVGDTPAQIEAKRKHRADVIAALARESGKGYRPSYSFDDQGYIKLGPPTYAKGATTTAAPATTTGQSEQGGGAAPGVVRWTRDAQGNPVPAP